MKRYPTSNRSFIREDTRTLSPIRVVDREKQLPRFVSEPLSESGRSQALKRNSDIPPIVAMLVGQ